MDRGDIIVVQPLPLKYSILDVKSEPAVAVPAINEGVNVVTAVLATDRLIVNVIYPAFSEAVGLLTLKIGKDAWAERTEFKSAGVKSDEVLTSGLELAAILEYRASYPGTTKR
jgi:hypothetical protein